MPLTAPGGQHPKNRMRAAVGLVALVAGGASVAACHGLTGAEGTSDRSTDPEAGAGPGSPSAPQASTVVISELMYAPVAEDADEDNHEFVEIYNRSGKTVSLGGWTLQSKKGVSFTFPPDASVEAGQFRVVSKNRKRLAGTTGYALSEQDLLGDYRGELGNGGDTVTLADAEGRIVDGVTYDDQFPWPLSADALGVGEAWLPDDQKPLSKHQYRGRSLERLSADFPTNSPANWEASALDGATPGKINSAAGVVVPVVESYSATPVGGNGGLIRANQGVSIRASFSAFAPTSQVELEYFVDDFYQTSAPPSKLAMTSDGNGGYTAFVDAKVQADNAVIRYRIRAVRGGRLEVAAPRATDPLQWFSYFVTPTVYVKPGIETKERVYHLFIRPADWTKIDAWSAAGRFLNGDTCKDNPDWDSTVPATLVSEGKVYDVRVRYEGSRGNRGNSAPIVRWPYPGPTLPPGKPLRSYSWRLKFPRYDRFEGKRHGLAFNKMCQGCPGTVSFVESRLLAKAGLPTYEVSFARLHINGGYYNYVDVPEDIDETLLERAYPDEAPGELFKDDGYAPGMLRTGDYHPLTGSTCQGRYKPADLYAATYPRVTFTYRPYDELIKLITDLDAATKAGDKAVRSYFMKYWDWQAMLTTLAVRNWAGAWDDIYHNSFPYKAPSTGKWLLIQQDFEMDFGLGKTGYVPTGATWDPNQTLYHGWNSPDPRISRECELPPGPISYACNRNGQGFNAVKSAFIGAFKTEFDRKMLELTESPNGVLSTESVSAVVDEAIARFSMEDWLAAPPVKMCNVDHRNADMYKWTKLRNGTVTRRLRAANGDAGAPPDGGASTSGPPPGEGGAAIDWTKCMGGDQPGVSAVDFCAMYEKTCPFSAGDDFLYASRADCLAKYKVSRGSSCRAGGLCFASYVDESDRPSRETYCRWAAGWAESGLWGCAE